MEMEGGSMAFVSKFTEAEMREICVHIRECATQSEDESWQMTIADAEMCSILSEYGFRVNTKFVERTRNKMGIRRRGVLSRKFTEAQMFEIYSIMKEHTREITNSWQLMVSDSEMSNILGEHGYEVNVKYVERTRRSLGIEPLGERGAKPGVSRPSASSLARDAERADLINLHNAAVYQLSYRVASSGALRGQSGSDISDKYGLHTLSFEEAVQRKIKMLSNTQSKSVQRPWYIESSDSTSENETEAIFADEVAGTSAYYGKVNKKGRIQNIHTSQVLSSL